MAILTYDLICSLKTTTQNETNHDKEIKPSCLEELLVFPEAKSTNRLIELIDTAKSRIFIMMYRFEYPSLLEALIKARKRNIDVKIVLAHYKKSQKFYYDKIYDKTNAKLSINENIYNLLISNNIDIVLADCDSFFAYHSKMIIIDDEMAMIGTTNINENGFEKARNFFLIKHDWTLVDELSELFFIDYEKSQLTLDGTYTNNQRLAVSPVNYYDRLYALVSSAQHEICIYQTTFAHRALCDKLARLADSGVRVKIITSKRTSKESSNLINDINYCESILKNHRNIEYKYLNEPFYVHAKVVIVDAARGPNETTNGGVCFMGSSLFTMEGFHLSREAGIVSDNPRTVKQIQETFDLDFNLATDVYNGNFNII